MNTKHEARQTNRGGSGAILGLVLCGLAVAGDARLASAQPVSDAKSDFNVVVSLSQWNQEVLMLRRNLSGAMAALEGVKAAAAKNENLAKPYANYSDALTTLDVQVAKLRQNGLALKAKAKEHWAAWQTELTAMQHPQLREKAQRRYSATEKEFQKITEAVETAKKDFAPLMADMKDINTYLKADLSKEAVSSISSTIWGMSKAARSVDSDLGDVNEQIDRVIKKMPQT